jgi:FMN phosphatase YigB (HAD superfamily)
MRLLITDLDNTLYDWVTYFANSFSAMVRTLATVIAVPEETLLDEFKVVHQRYGNSEQPFAIFELPSVREAFPGASGEDLLVCLDLPLQAFRSTRAEHLRLYPTVESTLRALQRMGVTIVAHTEAIAVHSHYRLLRLGIVDYFRHIYALEGYLEPHPNPERAAELEPKPGFISTIPKSERKPNPELLLDICKRERVSPSEAWYVGDSLTRDISMAERAGVTGVWARYGTKYDKKLWDILVRITHWTDEDVRREAELRELFCDVQPDYIIDSFDDLLRLARVSSIAETAVESETYGPTTADLDN